MAELLSVYNQILLALGGRELDTLSVQTSERRTLDTLWTPGLRYCLSRGQWKFATRTGKLTPESAAPSIGFTFAFAKPADWVRTTGLSTDDRFFNPLNHYVDEQGFWFADVSPLYLRYVSNDDEFGGKLSVWPTTFERFVVAHLAAELYVRFSAGMGQGASAAGLATLRKLERDAFKEAAGEDAMNGPAGFPPTGSWVRSRLGGGTNRISRWDGTLR